MHNTQNVIFPPTNWLEIEESNLAPYAMLSRQTKGRHHQEEPPAYRTEYQRDRDRIVHSTAFRRLMHKTQVLVTQTNDHHRTRLTHTLEVAQISRTIARCLGLNEDLTETIALAHDLGHPPFGHAGEEALDECMKDHGGFEHNHHGLRIMDYLEYRYPDFPGLNLTWEVLESQAFHSKKRDASEIHRYKLPGRQPLLEAQVVDAADSLAYDTHDIDDALGLGLINLDDLHEVTFWQLAYERARQKHHQIGPLQIQATIVRGLINWQVSDLLEHTEKRIQQEGIQTIQDIRNHSAHLVEPGAHVRKLKKELEQFLTERVYRHHRVLRMAHKGRRIIKSLFEEFCRNPQILPDRYYQRTRKDGVERTVCDYMAGMTDRYAQDEYLRLFQPYHAV